MPSKKHTTRAPTWLLLRSLWVGVFLALLSCISVINPRLTRARPASGRILRTAQARLARMQARISLRRLPLPSSTRDRLGRELGCMQSPQVPLPDIDDMLIFCFGIPVVPWLKRVGVRQWNPWLEHLATTLRARYPEREDIAAGEPWEAWMHRHVHYVEVHFARIAGQRIAQLANALNSEQGQIYLFGHSAGGSAILQYLADLRDGLVVAPAIPLRAAVTLDAAVTGPARLWTGWPLGSERPARIDLMLPHLQRRLRLDDAQPRWRRSISWLRHYQATPFRGLGAWAQEQQFSLLTISNVADTFSHSALGDIPFIRMRIGRRFDVRGIVTGHTHLCIQRDPRVKTFLWWHERPG